MKNVFRILGTIALVAVIGFGVAACDDGGGSGGGGGRSGPNTPLPNNLKNTKWKNGDGYGIEFLETTFRKYGQWGQGDMTCFSAKENGKITGKIGTSNVWQYMDEETICTSYTITGNTIVFVGSDTKSWDKLLEGTWSKDVPGTNPGTDPGTDPGTNPGTGGNTDTALNGTWTGDDGDLTFNNGNFEMSGFMKGTYTTTGNNISVTVTHIHGDIAEGELESRWYTKAELIAAGFDDDELDELFFSSTGTYSISGNTLTMTMDGDTMTFTKGGGTNPGGSAITYTAVPNNTTATTAITLTFSASVSGLTDSNISITNGTGSVSKGTLSGSGTSWSLGITVNTAGNVTVSINKSGVESGSKTMAVAKSTGGGNTTWTAVTDNIFNRTIYGIVYGNGKFVAGGKDGKTASSTDGTTWTALTNDTSFKTSSVYTIAYGNNTFVAGTDGGRLMYLKDN